MDDCLKAEIDTETLVGIVACSRRVLTCSNLLQDRLRRAGAKLRAKFTRFLNRLIDRGFVVTKERGLMYLSSQALTRACCNPQAAWVSW